MKIILIFHDVLSVSISVRCIFWKNAFICNVFYYTFGLNMFSNIYLNMSKKKTRVLSVLIVIFV